MVLPVYPAFFRFGEKRWCDGLKKKMDMMYGPIQSVRQQIFTAGILLFSRSSKQVQGSF
jgi:hypothetical protein